MPITPDLPFPKNAGDPIRSKDWNDLVVETQRLDNAKVNRAGDAIAGSLTIAGALGVKTTAPKAPLHVVGAALVSDGDGYAVPNNRMASGSLTIGSITSSFGGASGWTANTAGLMMETLSDTEIAVHDSGNRIASIAQYQSASNGLTIGRDMGWGPIASLTVMGALRAGNSDLYFTKIDHSHTGFGNTAGYAAIENTVSHDALMVLGRAGAQVPGKPAGTKARVVRLWDFLEVNGELRVTGALNVLGDVALGSKHAFRSNDAWLRLNQDLAFTSGVHTPGLFAPMSLNVGGSGGWVNPGNGNIAYLGQLLKLDVADNFAAYIRCGDFLIGHSSRRGTPGRALVDNTTTLVLNYGTDWSAGVRYYGSIGAASSRRLKEDIHSLGTTVAEQIFENLKPVTYHLKTDPERLLRIGFIAEDSPDQVTDKNKESVTTDHIIPVLIKVVQQQQSALKNLMAGTPDGSIKTFRAGMDFAEYFESADKKQIKPGTSVILDAGKVRAVKKGEIPIGVTSKNPGILGGDPIEWPSKYLKNEFGEVILEDVSEEILVQQTKKVKSERQKLEKKSIEEEVFSIKTEKRQGKLIAKKVSEKIMREVMEPVFQEIDLYDDAGKEVIGKERVPVMEAFEVDEPVFDENGNPVMVGSGKFQKKKGPKLNPKFVADQKYVPRGDRPEWNCVGLMGQIPLRKGQPVAPTWVKIRDISDEVELWLVK